MKLSIWLTFFILVSSSLCQDDLYMTLQQRCDSHGFGYEEHEVTTSDGYILSLVRISYGPDSVNVEERPPIYFSHPLAMSAQIFAYLEPESSPAFYFANLGYDVWLNNIRGNTYSRRHQTLDPNSDPEFWEFDMNDITEDHRANIQHILEVTGYAQIHNFAYSVGGATLAMALATDPEWFGSRMSSFTPIAVPANLAHTNSFLYSTLSMPWILNTVEAFGIHHVLDQNLFVQGIAPNF